MSRTIAILALSCLPALAAPASAGFYMEGLAPHSFSYCEGRNPATSDAFIKAPPETWEKTSPKADDLKGSPAWVAANCPTGKDITRAPRHYKAAPASRPHRKPAVQEVPQK